MRDWTPILKGDEYCAPACGYGCKKADYDEAVIKANELAAKLGPQWTPRVHENGRWFWGAVSTTSSEQVSKESRVSGTYPNKPQYFVSIVLDGIGQVYGDYDDPVAGVKECAEEGIRLANLAIASATKLLEE